MSVLTACVLGAGVPSGCGSGPTTTRLAADDLITFSEKAARSLAASDAITVRGTESPPWVIAIRRPRNLSHDVIPVGERWFVIERLKDSLAISRLARERNLVFVIDRTRSEEGATIEDGEPTGFEQRHPTHVLESEFRSIERRSGEHRTDAYAFAASLRDLSNGEIVWNDSFVIKRGAHGRAWD